MSADHFADVFPDILDFVKGEQPTAAKFNGMAQLIDGAFADITEGIGDPWDTQGHTCIGGDFTLSPKNLAQASLARIIGPSDYLSPSGVTLKEHHGANTIVVRLESGRNQWCFGFPLVEMTLGNTISPKSTLNDVTAIDAATFIVTLDTENCLDDRKPSLDEVVEDGDYYINPYTGTLTCYKITSSYLEITITNINILAAGPPWATHNVIPTWDSIEYCNVTLVGAAPNYTYDILFPQVSATPRIGQMEVFGASEVYNGSSVTKVTLETSTGATLPSPSYELRYHLPYSLTSVMVDGDEIPEGYILLWDDHGTGRFIPNCTFHYKDESHIQVHVPSELDPGDRYRIIVSGCSAAEMISYLSSVVRDNRHVGLTQGATTSGTLAYTPPLSHNHLTDLWSLTGNYTHGTGTAFKFRRSSYDTNDHPQYLHRAGYLKYDTDGNTANAMRGNIVFSKKDDFELDCDRDKWTETYGLKWGGDTRAFTLKVEGGKGLNWTSGQAVKLGFGLTGVGASVHGSHEFFGALTYTPYYGTPLYLRGISTPTVDDAYQGAVLGFDLKHYNEMNYVKLFKAIRDGLYDYSHLPVHTLNQDSWTVPLGETPGLTNRLAPEQMREFRFRGVPYIYTSLNTGLGAVATEFEQYFTSPGIVGADFFNVYSNAIFFSEEGDGEKTSFTERGEDWLNDSAETEIPSGIYYQPGTEAIYKFTLFDGGDLTTKTPLTIGSNAGFIIDTNQFHVNSSYTRIDSSTSIWLDATTTVNIDAAVLDVDTTGNIDLDAGNSINFIADDDIIFESGREITGNIWLKTKATNVSNVRISPHRNVTAMSMPEKYYMVMDDNGYIYKTDVRF